MRSKPFFISTGVRLAFLQTLLLLVAFVIAVSLTQFSVRLIYRNEIQSRILGEASVLRAMEKDKGPAAVAAAMAQSGRRPEGLEYRLESKTGARLGGDLPATGLKPGWSYLDWDDEVVAGRPFQDLYVYTEVLADGAVLTIARDLSEESKLRHALKRTLFWCAVIGSAASLTLSFLLSRGPLRRIDDVVAAARSVSSGKLQVRARTRKRLAPDDIDALGLAFNAMLDEIAASVTRLQWVSTDIAHDLRTPLTHVQQKLERLKAAAEPQVRDAVEEIDQDIAGLLRTFDAMLRVAEIENDPNAAHLERIDLAALAAAVVEAYRPDIEASGRTLDIAAAPAPVDGDADLLNHAIANLIENALRHTPADAHIRVEVRWAEDRAMLSVADNGPGIPADQFEAVLQRFHRLEASRTTPGSGLGLPIVTAIARRHGARLVLADAQPGLKASLIFPAPK